MVMGISRYGVVPFEPICRAPISQIWDGAELGSVLGVELGAVVGVTLGRMLGLELG
jgi:hypothetical protein